MKTIRTLFSFLAGMGLLASCGGGKPEYNATGLFEATEVTVSSEASGKLWNLDLEEGSTLKAGQCVGLVDTVQLYLKKRQLQASMKSVDSQRPDIRKQIAATEQQLATARRERDRVKSLIEANAGTRKQLDDWDAQIRLLNRQLEAQKSSLGNSTASLTEQSTSIGIQVAQIEDQLRKCRITAPIDGTVLAKYAEAGEVTGAGKPLFKMADMTRVYLRAYITSSQLAHLQVGSRVKVFADYGEDSRKEYAGTVAWISDQAEFTPKTILTEDERANQVYAVKITVKNDGFLKLGMYGGVEF